jgi:hypothetical protein
MANITLFSSTGDTVAKVLTREEARTFLRGGEEFHKMIIVQDGIRGIIGDMYVTVYNNGDGSGYTVKLSSDGWLSSLTATRDKLYTALMAGRGLWTLM